MRAAVALVLAAGAVVVPTHARAEAPRYAIELTADDDALERAGLVDALAAELETRDLRVGPARPGDTAHLMIVDRDGQLEVIATWPGGKRLTRAAPRPAADDDAVEVVRFIVGTMLRPQDDALPPPPPAPPPTWDTAFAIGAGIAHGGVTTGAFAVTGRLGYGTFAFGLTLTVRGDDHLYETRKTSAGYVLGEDIDGVDLRAVLGVDARLIRGANQRLVFGVFGGACRATEHNLSALDSARVTEETQLAPAAGVAVGVGQRLGGPVWVSLRAEAWGQAVERPRLDALVWLGWGGL